jgi:hypothetical protein
MGVKQNQKKHHCHHHPQSGRLCMDATSLTRDADPIQQPHDSGKKAWKRVRRYMAERSIVCTVFIFIEAITGPLNSMSVSSVQSGSSGDPGCWCHIFVWSERSHHLGGLWWEGPLLNGCSSWGSLPSKRLMWSSCPWCDGVCVSKCEHFGHTLS